MNIRKFFVLGFSFCFVLAAYAQQGNIVEYFGKDKVLTTKEGQLIHRFDEGLSLPQSAPRGNNFFSGQNLISWYIATGNYKRPKEGDEPQVVYAQSPERNSSPRRGFRPRDMKWIAVKTDSTGVFGGADIYGSSLYTSYNSDKEQIVLLDATGHTKVYVNGMQHEGDLYDFGYTLIPIKLKKGLNEFIYSPGRFPKISSKLVAPKKGVMLTDRDMTLANIITGENNEKWGAVRVINALDKPLKDLTITCQLESGEKSEFLSGDMISLDVKKMKFKIPASASSVSGDKKAILTIADSKGNVLDNMDITLKVADSGEHHERTFISGVEGSVQYYSVAPSTIKADSQAMFLTVHGASVEASGQSRAYAKKDWGHVVAATNRRPYGFNWEEWGRIDAMEVLAEAEKLFKTDPKKTYLTGHSMGGHGTWFLGVTYPDRFAAIAPCASYPDISTYGSGGEIKENNVHFDMIKRAANAGRTISLGRNYLQSGVYILHGSADRVVDTEQARQMRNFLGGFHPDFCYYEYPGGEHWYGNHSVDWQPIFDYFRWHTVPDKSDVNSIEFSTASPAVSASNYWVKIDAQDRPYDFSNIKADVIGDTVKVSGENISNITLDLPALEKTPINVVEIGGKTFSVDSRKPVILRKASGIWNIIEKINPAEKYAGRYGGFKQAFDNNVVLVYATKGDKTQNKWYKNRARFDSETFTYIGNASIDIVSDVDFLADKQKYADRNVVLYGNSVNNAAWNSTVGSDEINVTDKAIRFGQREFTSDDLAAYFIVPRKGSDKASVGVVAATGDRGMNSLHSNSYISGRTGFPDVMIFSSDMLLDGISGMKVSGFFGNDWSIKNGNFVY